MTFCTDPWLSSTTRVSAPLPPLATASANCTASAWLRLSALPARTVIGGTPSAAVAVTVAATRTATPQAAATLRLTLLPPRPRFRRSAAAAPILTAGLHRSKPDNPQKKARGAVWRPPMAMCHTARHTPAREDAMTTLLYTHEACLEHDPGSHHPESPDRLRAVLAGLSRPDFTRVKRREAPRADLDDVARVHPRHFIEAVVAALRRGGAARGGCGLRRGRCGRRRRGRQRLLRRAPAGPPRRARARHGLLPLQQRRHRRAARAPEARPRARRRHRLRRASRQRHPGDLREQSARLLCLDAPVAALSRHRRAQRDRCRQCRQCAAAADVRLDRVPPRL